MPKPVIFLSIVLVLTAAPIACLGFESRFYPVGTAGSTEQHEFKKIAEAWSTADQTLECNGIDDFFDVHPPEKGASSPGWIRRSDDQRKPISFTRQEIINLLKGDDHKHLLVIWILYKFKTYDPSNIEKLKHLVSDLEPFIDELGYQRVLVIKGSEWPAGLRVLKDTDDE